MHTPLEIAHAARTTAEWVRNPDTSDKIAGALDNRYYPKGDKYSPKVRNVPDRFCALGYLGQMLHGNDVRCDSNVFSQIRKDLGVETLNHIVSNFNNGIERNDAVKIKKCAAWLDVIADHYEEKIDTATEKKETVTV